MGELNMDDIARLGRNTPDLHGGRPADGSPRAVAIELYALAASIVDRAITMSDAAHRLRAVADAIENAEAEK